MAKLVSRLSQIADATKAEIGEAVQSSAEAIRDTAKTLAPVKTGNLRRSITKRKTGDMSAEVGTPVDYGVFQEYGTSRIGGRFYLTQAFASGETVFKQKLLEAARKAGK